MLYRMLYIISTAIDYMHQLYMPNYPVIYSLYRERDSGSKQTSDCVYLSKIENSSYLPSRTCITSNARGIEALSLCSHKITPATFPRQILTKQVACASSILPNGLESAIFQDDHFLFFLPVHLLCTSGL